MHLGGFSTTSATRSRCGPCRARSKRRSSAGRCRRPTATPPHNCSPASPRVWGTTPSTSVCRSIRCARPAPAAATAGSACRRMSSAPARRHRAVRVALARHRRVGRHRDRPRLADPRRQRPAVPYRAARFARGSTAIVEPGIDAARHRSRRRTARLCSRSPASASMSRRCARVSASPAAASSTRRFRAGIDDGRITIAPDPDDGFLASLLPAQGIAPVWSDLDPGRTASACAFTAASACRPRSRCISASGPCDSTRSISRSALTAMGLLPARCSPARSRSAR